MYNRPFLTQKSLKHNNNKTRYTHDLLAHKGNTYARNHNFYRHNFLSMDCPFYLNTTFGRGIFVVPNERNFRLLSSRPAI